MKNPSKTLSLLLACAVFLTACGGDKPAETAKPSPSTETAPTQPKTDEPKTEAVKTNEVKAEAEGKASEPKAEDTAKADSKTDSKEPPKADEVKADEPKDKPKTEVKALSIAEGKARYEKTCKLCHEQGLLDAPKLSDKANWAKRLDKGMDTLYAHSAKGFNKMPAQATNDVSEAEVYAAVDYMVSQVK